KPLLRHQETSGYANGDSAKARASQTNSNCVRTEGKKSQQYRKSDTMPPSEEPCARGKKSRVNYMLRSHGLRDSLSDRSSEEMPILSSDVAANNSVKIEVRNLEREVLVENMSTGVVQNGSNTVFRNGEMMVSLLWYYRPENTGQGRRAEDMEDEIFASKHKDIKSVACIKDKYRKGVRRLKDGIREPVLVVPQHEDYPRDNRQPPGYVAPELVFFCRRVYNYKTRRMLKNPR
ncbi:hypothetical protein C0J52_27384, partial [Blattella germanica]